MAMELNFMSVLLAVCTFLIIGLFHPLVIKTEYYFGTRPWWLWLVGGLASIVGALFISDNFLSTLWPSWAPHSFGVSVSSSHRRSASRRAGSL